MSSKKSPSRYKASFLSVLLLFALPVLTGCDKMMETPTWVSDSKVEVHDDVFEDSFTQSELTPDILRAIGNTYYRFGNGVMDVKAAYNPATPNVSKDTATKAAQNIVQALRLHGVKDPSVTVAAAPDVGQDILFTFSFPALTAKAPEACKGMLPGWDNNVALPNSGNKVPDYLYGCSVQSMIAQQIARPGDLLGRPGFETYADGRRQENVVSGRGYYGTSSLPPLEGEKSADLD